VLSIAHSYLILLAGAALLGVGSSVFHPESSRVARMASGGRHGLAQSLFQVGGTAARHSGRCRRPGGGALGSVERGVLRAAVAAVAAILWNVGRWYKHHGWRAWTAAQACAQRMRGCHARQ